MAMKIELIQGDITKLKVDAIVNAANSRLAGGGGVDGAIHRAGGPEIMKECDRIREKTGGCPTGEAVTTTAGRLSAKKVIHTVGPVWNGGNHNEETLLSNAYLNSLKEAVKHGLKSVAFPNISTGIYGYPKKKAAEAAIGTVKNFLAENKEIEKVIFVCFDGESYGIYRNILGQ
jgi:O-acetyl-ADP-ribose deacetylase